MDDAGDYRYTRRRRAITVAVSVVATVALCVGYAVADMCDVAPGVLTLRHVEHSTVAAAGRSIEAADVIADIDASKTIDPAAARALTDAFRASAAGFGGEFSIAIADASGNVAAENNIDVPRTPASTMKTLTAYAAAVELDMGKTLDTQTYLEQSQDGTARLVLKGNGDMLLGAGASDANHINGRAGLGTLAGRTAQALRQRGITSVTLAYDDTLFGNDRWPQGIAELDTDHLYYAPTASMAVDGGRNWNGTGPANPDVFSAYPALSMQPKIQHLLVLAGFLINSVKNRVTYRAVFVPAVAESEECVRRWVVSHVVKRIAQRTAIAIAVPRILLILSERADVCCIACLQVDLREVLNHLAERIVVCEETIVVLTI